MWCCQGIEQCVGCGIVVSFAFWCHWMLSGVEVTVRTDAVVRCLHTTEWVMTDPEMAINCAFLAGLAQHCCPTATSATEVVHWLSVACTMTVALEEATSFQQFLTLQYELEGT